MASISLKRFARTDTLQRLVLVLVALVLSLILAGSIVALGYYITHNTLYARTYPLTLTFADTQGVDAGAPVKMAGVTIGQVQQVKLDGGQASMNLQIKEGIRIPSGSRFIAVPPLFTLPGSITVLAPAGSTHLSDTISPGESRLVGQTVGSPVDTLARANVLMDQLITVGKDSSALLRAAHHTLDITNVSVGDRKFQREIQGTFTKVHQTAANGAEAMQQLVSLLHRTNVGTGKLLADVTDTTLQVKEMAKSSRPALTALLASSKRTADSVVSITSQTDTMLKEGRYGPRLSKLLTALDDTTANLKTITTKIDKIADKTQALISDPERTANVNDILRNMKTVTENSKVTTEKLNKLLTDTQPLSSDPQVIDDTKATLHSLREVTEVSAKLLQKLSQTSDQTKKSDKTKKK